jgi:hypothetical protein
MLRLLIGTGILLMVVGFGAAGFQYWQSRPATVAAVAPEPIPDPERWLASPTGGVVPQNDVRAFLVQERFVASRRVELVRSASLGELLDEGEKLPAQAYYEVLADIRAPRVAAGLCNVLTGTFAADCALNAARVLEGSVDPSAGTAKFRLELVYRVRPDGADLPDLAAHVLRTETVRFDLEPGAPGSESAEAALLAATSAVGDACAGDGNRLLCRPMRIWLSWETGRRVSVRAEIAWLDPLPEGVYVAPPLVPASGG